MNRQSILPVIAVLVLGGIVVLGATTNAQTAVMSNQAETGSGGSASAPVVQQTYTAQPVPIAVTAPEAVDTEPNIVFSEESGIVAAVSVDPQTATITFYAPVPLAACQEGSPCSYGKETTSTAILNQGKVMVLDANDGVENDFTQMKVGNSVVVYFKSGGTITDVPYVVKDNSLTPSSARYGVSSGGIVATATAQQTYTIQPVPAVTSTPGIISSAPVPVSAITITEDIGIGSDSNQVPILQSKLKSLGYFPANTPITGYFGSITEKAVQSFQAVRGIPDTGYVGPLTRQALEK